MKKTSLIVFADGATARINNKRIAFAEKDGNTMIKFHFADADAEKPACYHKCHKGKVRETFVKMSNEAMELLVYSWMQYKRERAMAKQNGA